MSRPESTASRQPVRAGQVGEDSATEAFLELRDLRIHFATDDGLVRAVDGLSCTLERGKTLGIVGESGSGKSVTSLGILGLHNRRNARVSGEIWLDGQELVSATPETVRRLRGRRMAMIFQDPLSAMHPYYTVGAQIIEAYRVHNKVSRAVARKHAIDLLGRVGIPQPAKRVDDYPHQFSGGMRQRAMIAMALSCDPELLIADEPTTALDVTVQAQILDLMHDLQAEFNSALIIITHDLGVVAELADDLLVMYAGKCVEQGPARTIFESPEHPYTWGLLGSMPRLDRAVSERLLPIPGTPPSLINVPPGCAFHPRCGYESRVRALGQGQPVSRSGAAGVSGTAHEGPVSDSSGAAEVSGTAHERPRSDSGTAALGRTRTEAPELVESAPGHLVRCHLPADERRRIWTTEVKPKLEAS